MTLRRYAITLLAQSAGECKRHAPARREALRAAGQSRAVAVVCPLRVCRALPGEQRCRPGTTRRAGGACGVGQSVHFASLEELLAFIARVLATVRGPPQQGPKRGGK